MEQKIDIDRLFVALCENVRNEEQYRWLDGAMKDLGLSGNGGKIVEINSEKVEPSKIEAGKWYMCTKTTSSEDDRVWFKHGELYKGEDILRCDMGFEAKDYKDYFRPATEEEIPHNTIKFDNVPETDFGKEEELTEFEKELQDLANELFYYSIDCKDEIVHKRVNKLLSIAENGIRKRIASEVDVFVLSNSIQWVSERVYHASDMNMAYRQGIKDTLEEIAGKESEGGGY